MPFSILSSDQDDMFMCHMFCDNISPAFLMKMSGHNVIVDVRIRRLNIMIYFLVAIACVLLDVHALYYNCVFCAAVWLGNVGLL